MDIIPIDGNIIYRYLSLFIVATGIWYWYLPSINKNLPPGPNFFTLIGNAIQMGSKPHIMFMKLSKIYGPIMRLKIVMEEIVVLSDPQIMKELFDDPLTTGRDSEHPIIYELSQGPYGVLNADGSNWEAQRKFTMRTLREFGFSKTSILEEIILTEVEDIINWFKERQGTPISGNIIFMESALNIMSKMVYGDKYAWKNTGLDTLAIWDEFLLSLPKMNDNGVYFLPFLRFIFPEQSGWRSFKKCTKALYDLIKRNLETHNQNFDKSNLRDFIDCHLKEINETQDVGSSFYKDTGHKNLMAVVFDLFFAGSATTSTTLSWVLLYVSHHQEVQKKIHMEIDKVIGSSRSPTLYDRSKMLYTEAVIMETMRLSSVVALGAPHRTTADMHFKGFFIRKNTTILANLYAIHHDSNIWAPDPENFRPERFLNEDGTRIIHNEAFVPFAEGKRKCLGDKLGRDILFLFVTGIFLIFSSSGVEYREKEPAFEAEVGSLVPPPKLFKIVMSPRNWQ